MKLEIISKKENALLERTEVLARVHGYEATPKRDAIAEELAKELKCPKEALYLLKVTQPFGGKAASVTAQVYKTAEALTKTIHKKRLLRGKPKEAKPVAQKKKK